MSTLDLFLNILFANIAVVLLVLIVALWYRTRNHPNLHWFYWELLVIWIIAVHSVLSDIIWTSATLLGGIIAGFWYWFYRRFISRLPNSTEK